MTTPKSPTTEPPGRKPGLAAPRVVRLLREEILATGENLFLGGEEDLLARYAISRPTLRQAARVLEHEQLLSVKRGIGGGYYTRRPTIASVGRSAVTYLRTRPTTVGDMLEAAHSAHVAMVQRAAMSENPEAEAVLRDYLKVDGGALSFGEFLHHERGLYSAICKLAGNPVLELFITILYQFGLEETRLKVFEAHAERMGQWFALRQKLVKAILAKEPEFAEIFSRRAHALINSWASADAAA